MALRGWVLRDVAVQRLYWLVSGQGYGYSGKGCDPCEGCDPKGA